jgi:hypothetical protein
MRDFKVYDPANSKSTAPFVSIEDQVAPYYDSLALDFVKVVRRVQRNLLFITQKELKEQMRRSIGVRKLSPVTANRAFDYLNPNTRGVKRKRFAGDISVQGRGLVQAIGYHGKKLKQTGVGDVGWLSRSAVFTGLRFQKSIKKKYSPKMKRAMFYLAKRFPSMKGIFFGMIAKGEAGEPIVSPERPVVAPVFNRLNNIYPRLVEIRIQYIMNDLDRKAAKYLAEKEVKGARYTVAFNTDRANILKAIDRSVS